MDNTYANYVTPTFIIKQSTARLASTFHYCWCAIAKKAKNKTKQNLSYWGNKSLHKISYKNINKNPQNLPTTNLGKSFHILCSQCIFTNCITSALDKQYFVFIILKRPSYVILPIDMHDNPWCNNSTWQILRL